jgi:ABC-type uncharacterized transport system substrate-binding protein
MKLTPGEQLRLEVFYHYNKMPNSDEKKEAWHKLNKKEKLKEARKYFDTWDTKYYTGYRHFRRLKGEKIV